MHTYLLRVTTSIVMITVMSSRSTCVVLISRVGNEFPYNPQRTLTSQSITHSTMKWSLAVSTGGAATVHAATSRRTSGT